MELLKREEPFFHHFLSSGIGNSEYGYNLESGVCNHGFFMMAPNRWCPQTKTLQRPLRLSDGTTSVLASITHTPDKPYVSINVYGVEHLSDEDAALIQSKVNRMLRLTEILEEFHKKHPEAKKKAFGRLFRSPTLFEDAVKCILLCNCTWKRTLSMTEALCKLQPELASVLEYETRKARKQGKRFEPHAGPVLKGKTTLKVNNKRAKLKPNPSLEGMANFPSSKELALVDVDYLNMRCNLGHRAKTIIDLAVSVESGKLKLKEHESSLLTIGGVDDSRRPHVDISNQLKKIKGFGPFTCANILMCIGFYHQIPTDTETIRLVRKLHGKENCTRKTIENDVKEIYGKYEPYQCLAYWFDLLNDYESMFGKLSELSNSSYHTVSGSIKSKENVNESNNGE